MPICQESFHTVLRFMITRTLSAMDAPRKDCIYMMPRSQGLPPIGQGRSMFVRHITTKDTLRDRPYCRIVTVQGAAGQRIASQPGLLCQTSCGSINGKILFVVSVSCVSFCVTLLRFVVRSFCVFARAFHRAVKGTLRFYARS